VEKNPGDNPSMISLKKSNISSMVLLGYWKTLHPDDDKATEKYIKLGAAACKMKNKSKVPSTSQQN
jgi:hypothetical protein